MQRVFPTLRITAYEKSKLFYIDGLGFHIDWEHRFEPHLPVFMQITRDGMSLFLSQHSGDCHVGGAVYFFIDDVDQWHRSFLQHGVHPEKPLQNTSYGLREMCVVDPDGNRLRFGTNLKNGAPEI
ncbi:MAG: VOC family protein [Acidobacteriia bacterium]|nr:VOC family protein [Terriglobia bacterium]